MYNAINELKQQIDAIVMAHPELEDDETLRLDTFEGETDIQGLLTKMLEAANDAKAFAHAIDFRMKELGLRKSRFEVKNDALRRLMQSVLERAGLPKIALTEATLCLTHYPPSPIVTDIELLPEDCIRVKREASISSIKAAIKEGRSIPGIEMSNGHTGLTVRTK